jgi:hypothetical protein
MSRNKFRLSDVCNLELTDIFHDRIQSILFDFSIIETENLLKFFYRLKFKKVLKEKLLAD